MIAENLDNVLEEKLKIEKLKSSIYRKIIEANTNIIIPDDNEEDILDQFNNLQKLFKTEIIEKTQIQEENDKFKASAKDKYNKLKAHNDKLKKQINDQEITIINLHEKEKSLTARGNKGTTLNVQEITELKKTLLQAL